MLSSLARAAAGLRASRTPIDPRAVLPRTPTPTSAAAASLRQARFERFRPTRVQGEMLTCVAPRRLLRGPNQIGKTEAMCADVVDLMLGASRWQPERARRHPVPVDCWVVCSSWKQSLVIQRKLYAMLGPDELAKGSKYTHKRGFTGQSFQTRNASLCTIVTINQDNDQLASATLDAVFVDEVPTEEAWGELVARVRQKSGQIAIYFTPINRPVAWVAEKVARGEIVEFHTGLSIDAVWPVGALRPFQTQAQLDAFVADCPPWQRAQRVHGQWEGTTEGRWLADFDPTRHVLALSPGRLAPTRHVLGEKEWTRRNERSRWELSIGLDYGLRPGKMAAALIAVREGHGTQPEVCFWDEEAAGPEETWSMEELAVKVLAMLARNGLGYDDVDDWRGDRSAVGKAGKVSNRDMRAHFAAATGRSWSETKDIKVPRKGAGSVAYGCGVMNSVFRRNYAWAHPRCKKFLAFAAHFSGNPKDLDKDAGDAHRYGLFGLLNEAAWYRAAA